MLKKIKYFVKRSFQLPIELIIKLPFFAFIRETKDYQCHITFERWFNQKILGSGENKLAYWPVHKTSQIVEWQNIIVGIDTYPGFMKGCYIQGIGGIIIGDYTQIASNVVIISANHNPYNTKEHIKKKVIIGKYCWIGANSCILPGVILGDFTVVGAGAVVTKSFPEGYCVIAGNPANKIKDLDKTKCIPFENKIKYNGYIKSDKFDEFKRRYLMTV